MGDSGWDPGAVRPGPSLWESACTWSRPLANRIHGTTPNKIHWAVIIGSDPLCGVRLYVLRWKDTSWGRVTRKLAHNKLQSEVNVLGGFTCMKNRPYVILIAAVDRVGNLKCLAQILIGDSGTMALCITSDCVKEYTDEKSQGVATCKSHRYCILCRRNDVYTAASVPYPSVTRRCGGENSNAKHCLHVYCRHWRFV